MIETALPFGSVTEISDSVSGIIFPVRLFDSVTLASCSLFTEMFDGIERVQLRSSI